MLHSFMLSWTQLILLVIYEFWEKLCAAEPAYDFIQSITGSWSEYWCCLDQPSEQADKMHKLVTLEDVSTQD